MSKDVLLIKPIVVKDKSAVHKNVDDSLIAYEIKAAQDMLITPAIGSCLMNRLQEGIELSDLTADEDTLIDSYITDALVYFVLASMPMGTAYQFFTKGVLSRTSDNTNQPSMNDMIEISNHYQNRGEWYRERLIKYLQSHRTTYPLYANCGDGCSDDIGPEDSGYTVSMWLGDD